MPAMMFGGALGWMRKHHPRDTALGTVDAVNRRDWEQLQSLLDNDFFYVDGEANRIETPDRFIASLRGLVADAPDFTIEVDSVEDAGSMVYMHGRTISEDFRFRSHSMWRARIAHGRMQCLENFRATNAMRLTKYDPQAA
jgi:hypothetical protein